MGTSSPTRLCPRSPISILAGAGLTSVSHLSSTRERSGRSPPPLGFACGSFPAAEDYAWRRLSGPISRMGASPAEAQAAAPASRSPRPPVSASPADTSAARQRRIGSCPRPPPPSPSETARAAARPSGQPTASTSATRPDRPLAQPAKPRRDTRRFPAGRRVIAADGIGPIGSRPDVVGMDARRSQRCLLRRPGPAVQAGIARSWIGICDERTLRAKEGVGRWGVRDACRQLEAGPRVVSRPRATWQSASTNRASAESAFFKSRASGRRTRRRGQTTSPR